MMFAKSNPSKSGEMRISFIAGFLTSNPKRAFGKEYTVKAVISNMTDGTRYYDHKLTNIEKGKLIDIINESKISYVRSNLSIHLHESQIKLLKNVPS